MVKVLVLLCLLLFSIVRNFCGVFGLIVRNFCGQFILLRMELFIITDAMFYITDEDGNKIDEMRTGDRIVRATSVEYLINTVDLHRGEDFVKVFTSNLLDVANELTGQESILMMILIGFIQYNTGILTHKNGRPVTRECITKMADKDKTVVDRLLDSLSKKQIIGKHKTGRTVCFTVNPFIFMKGNRVNKTLAKFFENSRWAKG